MFQNIQRESEQPSQTLIQPHLEIGKEDDEHEKEANNVADKVMRMADPEEKKKKMTDDDAGKVRMMIDDKDEKEKMIDEDDGKVRMMKNAPVIHKMTDGSSGGVVAPQNVEQGINSSKGNGQSLPSETQQELGGKMDADFSDVKIHTGGNAVEMNKEIGAKAFTHGNDIYFNEGQYNPSSGQGKHLLAHELTHTVQQGKTVDRSIQRQAETPPKQSRVVKLTFAELKKDIIDEERVMELIGEFSTEDVRDHMQGIMHAMKDKVKDRTYIDSYIIFQDNYLLPEGRKELNKRSQWQETNLENVKDVKSITVEKVYDDVIPTLFDTVKSKLDSRTTKLQTVQNWKEVSGNATVKKAVSSSLLRWTELRKTLNNESFDKIGGQMPATIYTDITNEENDINQIPGKSSKERLYYTKNEMREFVTALRRYLNKRTERKTEIEQFHRFDELFVQAKMYKILGVYNVFSPATIKALVARESGDFTYIEVAGVGKDKPGYQNKLKPKFGATYTGIAQMGAPAKTEAIDWANKNGIQIPAKVDGTDTRDLPEYAVLLSAAYLSDLYNELKTKYGTRFPTDVSEKRKIVFAAYNWSLSKFNAMVAENFTNKEVLTYAAIKPHLPGETQTYVIEIYKRLG